MRTSMANTQKESRVPALEALTPDILTEIVKHLSSHEALKVRFIKA